MYNIHINITQAKYSLRVFTRLCLHSREDTSSLGSKQSISLFDFKLNTPTTCIMAMPLNFSRSCYLRRGSKVWQIKFGWTNQQTFQTVISQASVFVWTMSLDQSSDYLMLLCFQTIFMAFVLCWPDSRDKKLTAYSPLTTFEAVVISPRFFSFLIWSDLLPCHFYTKLLSLILFNEFYLAEKCAC